MSRVSTFGQSQALLNTLLKNQSKVFESQEQLNSGKNAKDFRGFASEATTLINSKSFLSRVDNFKKIISTVQGKIDANDVQLNGVLNMARDFRQSVVEVLAQGDAFSFEESLSNTFSFIVDSLNTEVGGSFIFGGSKTDTPPVNISKISELVAATSAADVFENDQQAQKARVTDNVEMDYSLLADDIAKDLFTSIKTIADYHFGASGPLNGPLSAADVTFLTDELAKLDDAIDVSQSVQTRNGLKFERLQTISDQHGDTSIFLETFISNIEDTNIAEAITKLNMDKVALESSIRTLALIADLSLLDFI
jgi:flagellar hook-associated protein 3 FlgL